MRSGPRGAPSRASTAVAATLPDVSMSEFDGVRYLHLGETPWVQGAYRPRKPRSLELEYVQRMMAWLLLVPVETWRDAPHELHAVQLGLGAAALTRFCHGVLNARTTAIELNPQVIGACHQWFGLPDDDERLSVLLGDAGLWAAQADNRASVDALCVDLYDQQAAAPVLDDDVFYQNCHAVLADQGVMSVNLFGRQASFARSARRIEAAFGAGQVRMLSPTKEGNTIVLAIKGGEWPAREVLVERAELIEARLGLPASKWPRLVKSVPVARASEDGVAGDEQELPAVPLSLDETG